VCYGKKEHIRISSTVLLKRLFYDHSSFVFLCDVLSSNMQRNLEKKVGDEDSASSLVQGMMQRCHLRRMWKWEFRVAWNECSYIARDKLFRYNLEGFWAMDVEKNFTSSLDREENKLFSFGRRETQKITWSDNPPTIVTLFWSRHESKKVTGTGHYAWTSW
jgi:hypothetical protein